VKEGVVISVATKRISKWVLRLCLIFLVAVSLWVGILVFPTPLFAYEARFGTFRVCSDEPIPADFAEVMEDADRRLQAMEHEPPDASQRVYLCHDQSRSGCLAFLARKGPQSLGIGLSVANETFVSVTRVRLFAATNRGVLKHTRFAGDVAEVIAHEIAHFNSAHALGYRAHLAQPVWTREGWAEYQANIAALRADPDYDLGKRIDQLLQNDYWSRTHSMARDFWEWQLLVEFLGEVEGYTLADLIREEVTESSAREQMMAWHQLQAERSTWRKASP
jgi:hypothetical protein